MCGAPGAPCRPVGPAARARRAGLEALVSVRLALARVALVRVRVGLACSISKGSISKSKSRISM